MRFRPAEDETPEQEKARRAMEAIAEKMIEQRHALLREYRVPVAIEVPESFPDLCDGSLLWGLPVRKAKVAAPRVVAEDVPSLTS